MAQCAVAVTIHRTEEECELKAHKDITDRQICAIIQYSVNSFRYLDPREAVFDLFSSTRTTNVSVQKIYYL